MVEGIVHERLRIVQSEVLCAKQIDGPPVHVVISGIVRQIVAISTLRMFSTAWEWTVTPDGGYLVQSDGAEGRDDPPPRRLVGLRLIAIPRTIELKADTDIGWPLQQAQSLTEGLDLVIELSIGYLLFIVWHRLLIKRIPCQMQSNLRDQLVGKVLVQLLFEPLEVDGHLVFERHVAHVEQRFVFTKSLKVLVERFRALTCTMQHQVTAGLQPPLKIQTWNMECVTQPSAHHGSSGDCRSSCCSFLALAAAIPRSLT